MHIHRGFLLVLIPLFLFASHGENESLRQPPAPSSLLGNLKIEISKVDQTTMIGDKFTGPSSYRNVGKIYLKIRNIGDFSVCVAIVPSVEEYKCAELQYTQSLTTGLAYNPKIRNLPPGAETSGYYEFKPSPQKRNYGLLLQARDEIQSCEKISGAAEGADTGKKTLR